MENSEDLNKILDSLRGDMDGLRPIIVLKEILFFNSGEEVSLAKMRHYYTNYAIGGLLRSEYMKWKDE